MPPPVLRINLRSPVPAYRQIVDALRAQLVEGALQPGHALPTVRRLALELGVHFNTIAEAYRQLAAEGWVELKHGRGATVIERSTPAKASGAREARAFRQRLRELVAQMRAAGLGPDHIASALRQAAESLEK